MKGFGPELRWTIEKIKERIGKLFKIFEPGWDSMKETDEYKKFIMTLEGKLLKRSRFIILMDKKGKGALGLYFGIPSFFWEEMQKNNDKKMAGKPEVKIQPDRFDFYCFTYSDESEKK